MPSSTADHFLRQAGPRLAALVEELGRCARAVDVAWTLCEFAGPALGLVDCVTYLLDSDGRTLTQRAAWGPKRAADRVLESRIQLGLGQGIVGRCAQLRLPQRTADARLDCRYVVDDQFNLSELAVPICLGDTLFGVLDSEHPEADHYALAHEHALYAIAERGARRLRELAGTSAAAG
ncbi:GAF domain-containing protein [Luteimonas sp. RD2P54]|uniref:GAF domain-containing protein n=1 Tax=Luteimonas endophytica TaxID=3042023 RepID=A0ABT6JCI9_9GAMM|nr:GAF domain-containing protein [Luteimonas endophytica]MDH5824534.1 GAF domain-containing protein [Luteimonas endophytica]